MKKIWFVFKDGTKISVFLEQRIIDEWMYDKKIKKDIAKFGEVFYSN